MAKPLIRREGIVHPNRSKCHPKEELVICDKSAFDLVACHREVLNDLFSSRVDYSELFAVINDEGRACSIQLDTIEVKC